MAVSAEGDGVKLPIIMYHSLLNDSKLQNEYVISPEIFENDLKYLKNNGYSFLTVDDLIKYTSSDITLPEKCIMLTFDDGYYNNYYYAYPLLKKYNAKAVNFSDWFDDKKVYGDKKYFRVIRKYK